MWGTAMTGLSIAYGLSKFLMGSVSDRSNPKYFLPLGLLLSAGIIFVSGTVAVDLRVARAGHRAADAERMGPGHGLAALRQDDGPLVEHEGARPHRLHLERRPQRGRRAGRQLRAARRARSSTTGARSSTSTRWWRQRWPSGSSSCCATRRSRAACRRSRSTRTTTRRTTARTTSGSSATARSSSTYVLNNRYLWAIAVANAFVYFVRYGVVNWIPTYLADGQGLLVQAVEHRLLAVRVGRDPGHHRLRLDLGPVLQRPAGAGEHPVHGA